MEALRDPLTVIDNLLQSRAEVRHEQAAIEQHQQWSIDSAGRDAFAAVVMDRIKQDYPQYPDVHFKKGDERAETDIAYLDTQIRDVSREGELIVFKMRCPTNGYYTNDLMTNVRTLMKDFGFDKYQDRADYNSVLEPDTFAHVAGGIRTPEIVQKEVNYFSIAVDKGTLLDNLNIKEKAELSERDARIDKANELGVDIPG